MDLYSKFDVMKIMQQVESVRTSKSHALNSRSSRSHCIVTLTCTRMTGTRFLESRFHFVDLAGSERIQKTGATNLKAEEAKHIN